MHTCDMSPLIAPEAPPTSILESKLALEMGINGAPVSIDFADNDECGRSQATRNCIMDAARTHFVAHGYQATRLANVARDAFVAPSTVSLHFKGKEALFAACLVQDVVRLISLSQQVIEGNPVAHTSGEFFRVLARLLPRFPLLATAITLSPHRWGRSFYENVHVDLMIRQLEVEIRELQASGMVRPNLEPFSTARDLFRARASALWTVVATQGLEAGSLEFLLGLTTDAILTDEGRASLESLAAPWRHRNLITSQRRSAVSRTSDRVTTLGESI